MLDGQEMCTVCFFIVGKHEAVVGKLKNSSGRVDGVIDKATKKTQLQKLSELEKKYKRHPSRTARKWYVSVHVFGAVGKHVHT